MRKKLSLFILIFAAAVTGALLFRSALAPSMRVTVVLDGSAQDGSFGAQAVIGMERAAKELKIRAKYLECQNIPENYFPALVDAIAKSDFVICVGSSLAQHLSTAAQANPKMKFAIIDGILSAPNAVSMFFRANESSYLAGVLAARLAALKTDSLKPKKVIGLVIGCDIPVVRDFRMGYEAGAKSVEPETQILVDYAGSWSDKELGAKLANSQHERGANVIFQAAGGTGLGVLEAAQAGKFYAIGSDMPQDSYAPDSVVASAVKRVDNAVYDLIRGAVQKNLPLGKKLSLGLNEGAVGLAWGKAASTLVPPEVRAEIDSISQKIQKGEIEVPGAF